ncbi:(2Fe-2S)-binding protein [Novosphingobium sp. SG751A]|uniref:(2Fe-2S)-binding protein n=1 Tax=Novosphingobium sp. SG751A TaxID=2587000 RepID=UPI00352FF5D3
MACRSRSKKVNRYRVLLRQAPPFTRRTPVTHSPRAPFCMMGACFECLVQIDGGNSIRSCQACARDGMKVCRQVERPNPLLEATL